MKSTAVRLMRYGLVGVALNCAGYMAYLLLTWLGSEPKVTMTILYAFGATMGFFGHRRLAFNHHGKIFGSAARYGAAHLCGYGVNLMLLYVFVDSLGFSHQIVQAAAIFIVAGLLFLCFNFIVFPQSKGQGSQSPKDEAHGLSAACMAIRRRSGI